MADQRLSTVLWQGRWLIVICVVATTILAIVATSRTDEVFEATAVLQVASPGSPRASAADPLGSQQASQGLAATYATLIADRSFLAGIAPRVNAGRLSVGALARRVDAAALEETSLIELTVTGPSPEEAGDLAGEVAAAFLESVSSRAAEQSAEQQEQIENRIAALTEEIEARQAAGPADSEQLVSLREARNALSQQLADVIANGIEQGGTVVLTAPPSASAGPVQPRPVLNMAAGVLAGLIAGTGLALLRRRLDRGLHSANEAEEILDAPVLGSIPVRRRYSADDAVLGEAYDVLRANLAFIALDRPLRTIVFSSHNPREGKTSTVEGLARAIARSGTSVAIVDGDVRTRALSIRLGSPDAPGVTNVAAGLAELDDVIVELPFGAALVPAGPTPPNPSSLLSGKRMKELLRSLRDSYALVLVDAPPVANLADASILASIADGVLVVARVGITARNDLLSAATNLRKGPTPIVGAVVLERRQIDQTYYPAMVKHQIEAGDAVPS